MKTFSHILTTALFITSIAPVAKTTTTVSDVARHQVGTRPKTGWNNFTLECSGTLRQDTLGTLQPDAAPALTSSSDPAWLWAWVLAQGFDWIAI